MNGKEFKKEMQRLEVAFMKRYPEETLDVYWEELKDVDYGIFSRACGTMRKRENFLPILSTILRYIDEAKHRRFISPSESFAPLTEEQIKNQEETNRRGRLKVAQQISNSPDAGPGAKEWARKLLERNGGPLESEDGPEKLGDILIRK